MKFMYFSIKCRYNRLFCCNHACNGVNLHGFCDVSVKLYSVSDTLSPALSNNILDVHPRSVPTEFRGIGRGSSNWDVCIAKLRTLAYVGRIWDTNAIILILKHELFILNSATVLPFRCIDIVQPFRCILNKKAKEIVFEGLWQKIKNI